LLKHRFRPGSGWGMPGGFMKDGERPEDALRRELQEEVGLKLDNLTLFTTRSFIEPKQLEIVFRCRALGDPEPVSFEIQRAVWCDPDKLPEELPEDQARLIKSALTNGARPQD
jgi:ADP-ribose pyrophosphatase YjhB (NUDIX family)